MQTKLIKTTDYLLLTDEEAEIKVNDWYYLPNINSITLCIDSTNAYACSETNTKGIVIAYHPLHAEAKELDLPLLPNPFENSFDITKWAKEEHKYNHRSIHELSFVLGCEVGYEKAQAKQFSLEDMYSFAKFCNDNHSLDDSGGQYDWQPIFKDVKAKTNKEMFEDWKKSLSTQQLPVGFEPKFDRIRLPKGDDGWEDVYQLRITINHQGQKVVQGEYKFE